MRIAVTIWGNRISPVYDSSNTLLIADIEESTITERTFKVFNPRIGTHVLSMLKSCQVDALICGAITEDQSVTIEGCGVELLSFVSGDTETVLDAYLDRTKKISDFSMPGTGAISREH